jgi:para-nitrobenzyl esterase
MRFGFCVAAAAVLFLSSACGSVRPAWSVEKTLDETRRTTTEGDVIGGAGKHGGFVWLGIPFAAPPVGALRWRAPQPPAHRDAPLAATHFSRACAQTGNFLTINEKNHDGIFGDEDCLYLNVWAPPQAQGLPVMMWIHGGGNSIGSAAGFDLSTLAMKEHVVVVSVQYRLGPLGWLHHPALAGTPEDASGNYGTLDLVRALEWLRDNAKAFGGDPGNVTVFGESAGGTNTYSLLLTPKAKGLFHRAIAQSPFVSRTTFTQAEGFLEDKGHPNSSREVLVRLLLKRGAKDRPEAKAKLAAMSNEATAQVLRETSAADIIALYREGAPLIGGQLDLPMLFPDGVVMPASSWWEAFATPGGWNTVPVITGTNHDEAKLFQFLDPHFVYMLFGFLPRIRDEARYNATASQITRLWRGWCVDAVAQAMEHSGARDVWSYRFDWGHEPTFLGTDLSKLLGAAHGLEIPFVHGDFEGQNGQLLGGANNPERDALSQRMMDAWGAFARDGKPGGDWAPYDAAPDAPKYIVFDTPLDRVKMEGHVDDPEAVLQELLGDPGVEKEQKCGGLTKLVDMGFVSAERADKVQLCAGQARP